MTSEETARGGRDLTMSPVREAADDRAAVRKARALEFLRRCDEPVFALLDAARDPRILPLLRQGDCEYQSLYQGISAEVMAEYAPYLVRLPGASDLLGRLASEGWGESWGAYLTSRDGLAAVRAHLRQFTMVKLPEGKVVYFRFYDPRVLRTFLPTCNREEAAQFFGNLRRYLVEAQDGQALLEWSWSASGLSRAEIPL
jgi:Domain of unknown function (DUF4123)